MAYDWNKQEDRLQAGGCSIRMETNDLGAHVRYQLLVRRSPIWRAALKPIAMIVRCYADGTLTLTEDTWER